MSLQQQNLNNQLVVACRDGYVDKTRELLKQGANYATLDHAPFFSAIANGHIKIIELLIESGENIHVNNDAAILEAQNHKQTAVLEFLLSQSEEITDSKAEPEVRRKDVIYESYRHADLEDGVDDDNVKDKPQTTEEFDKKFKSVL